MKKFENDCILVDDEVGGKKLIVAFGGLLHAFGQIKEFEWMKATSSSGCRRIFVKDLSMQWYHNGISEDVNSIHKLKDWLAKYIADEEITEVRFIGSSAGGYAAIMLGLMLNVDSIMSFSGQAFIDTEARAERSDDRWPDLMATIPHEGIDKVPALMEQNEGRTKIDMFACKGCQLDVRHLNFMKDYENVTRHLTNCANHNSAGCLKQQGKLYQIITTW